MIKFENNWVCYLSLCPKVEHTQLFETVTKKLDIVGAIAQCITKLAEQEWLVELEHTLKEEYKPIFELIPHSLLLPDTVTA